MNTKSIKLVATTAVLSVVLSHGITVAQFVTSALSVPAAVASETHPALRTALKELTAARDVLTDALKAGAGKKDPVAGHRSKALDYIKKAIDEVNAGIAMK